MVVQQKVLITGFSRAACTRDFHKNSQIGLATAHYSLVSCLEDMGYAVDQRRVNIGEDLSGYHKIIVFLMHISPFDINIYNSLWTIANYSDKVILGIEDWQSPKDINRWHDVDKTIASITGDYYVNNVVVEKKLEPEWTRSFTRAVEFINSRKLPLILPAYLGGDIQLLFPEYPSNNLKSWYPTPYHLHRQPGDWEGDGSASLDALFGESEVTKERVWNFAGLIQSETEKWFNKVTKDATWPIEKFGSSSKGQERLTETEMVRKFQQHWGILMPGYWHAGSGWWRVRPQQVADVGSVLMCEHNEGAIYGITYQGLTVEYIESLTDKQLADLAENQRYEFYQRQPLDKSITKEQLAEII